MTVSVAVHMPIAGMVHTASGADEGAVGELHALLGELLLPAGRALLLLHLGALRLHQLERVLVSIQRTAHRGIRVNIDSAEHCAVSFPPLY